MASPPSPLLEDSLVSFSRKTHEAFVAVEADVRKAVAQAKNATREARHERDQARRERDEAVQARHAYQLEMQLLKQEVGEYNAALKQADTTIAHHEESIVQARREAAQWKDQSRNWQEHFLRVEQERCRLSTRVDELTAERFLPLNQAHTAPFTPRRTYADILDSVPSSASTKRGSSSSNPHRSRLDSSPDPKVSSDMVHSGDPVHRVTSTRKSRSSKSPNREARYHPPPTVDITSLSSHHHQPSSPTNRSQTQPRKPAAQALSQPPISISTARMSVPEVQPEQPRQVLIRRVHAVVQMPVKEEDAEVDLLDQTDLSASTSVSASLSGSDSIPIIPIGASSSSRKNRGMGHARPKQAHGRSIVHSDENEDSGIDDDFDDIEEVDPSELALSTSDHSDDEDDELMMGAEDNRKEVYGIKPIDNRVRHSTTKSLIHPATKKRKPAGFSGTQPPKKSRH